VARLAALLVALVGLTALASMLIARVVMKDPDNSLMPASAPAHLEEAAERSCVLGYRRVGAETSHIVAIEERRSGEFEVSCAYGPLDLPRLRMMLTCEEGEWNGPVGAGPNGDHAPYDITC